MNWKYYVNNINYETYLRFKSAAPNKQSYGKLNSNMKQLLLCHHLMVVENSDHSTAQPIDALMVHIITLMRTSVRAQVEDAQSSKQSHPQRRDVS